VKAPARPANETARLRALRSYSALDSARDEAFDALVRVASSVCQAPIALVSLVDDERQWFLASLGLGDVTETPRDVSFCGHAILQPELMVVEDATQDARFADNPLVLGAPHIRFYAGQPLVDKDGFALGTLCVIDPKPRTLTPRQASVLQELSRAMVRLLEARRVGEALTVAELEAKGARADLAVVLHAVPSMVGYWDQRHVNGFANAAYELCFGEPSHSLRGRHMREVLGEPLYELNRPHLERALLGEPQRFERETVDPTGRRRYTSVVYSPDVRDGKVHGVVATGTDVTELREALLTSQDRTALLELAEELAAFGHWRIEVGNDEIYWSPQVYRLHGVPPSDKGPSVAEAVAWYHPDDRARVTRIMERAFETGEPVEYELRVVRADGETRLVHIKARIERDPSSGRTSAIVGVIHDITEREALRERMVRQERLVTTGTLAQGVGHEINNPLTYVSANIDFALAELRDMELSAVSPTRREERTLREVIEVLEEARTGAGRIASIVRELRSFARENAEPRPTDVRAVITMSQNVAAHQLRARATITQEVGPVPLVIADESRLSQVLVNLLVNAAQAFPTGDPANNRVVVRALRLDTGAVAIEVEDNGPGIGRDVLPRIFDPFFTTKGVGSGTGLGLAISLSIVTSLGGSLTCATVPGRGTTFRVTLRAAEEAEAALPDAAQLSVAPAPLGARVLVVDDDEAVLRAVTRLLGPEQQVRSVSDAREALALIELGAPFDVVFCDLMMPNLDGRQLFERVRELAPRLAERFVFISAGTTSDEMRGFLASIPNACVHKPFTRGELRAVTRAQVSSGATPGALRASGGA
jgi:PAS domain S-box-containing protein